MIWVYGTHSAFSSPVNRFGGLMALVIAAVPVTLCHAAPPRSPMIPTVPIVLHVAPDGRPDAPGTATRPLSDLLSARNALRRLRVGVKQSRPAVVVVHGGDYYLPQGGPEFGSQDGGVSANASVIYRASLGERPHLIGGLRVPAPARAFHRVAPDDAAGQRLTDEAHPHVLAADLAALGAADFGALPPIYRADAKLSEVFVDGVPAPPARWPNGGAWASTVRTVDQGSVPRTGDTSGRTGAFVKGNVDLPDYDTATLVSSTGALNPAAIRALLAKYPGLLSIPIEKIGLADTAAR